MSAFCFYRDRKINERLVSSYIPLEVHHKNGLKGVMSAGYYN